MSNRDLFQVSLQSVIDGASDPKLEITRRKALLSSLILAKEPAVIAIFGTGPFDLSVIDSDKPGWRML